MYAWFVCSLVFVIVTVTSVVEGFIKNASRCASHCVYSAYQYMSVFWQRNHLCNFNVLSGLLWPRLVLVIMWVCHRSLSQYINNYMYYTVWETRISWNNLIAFYFQQKCEKNCLIVFSLVYIIKEQLLSSLCWLK